MNKAKLFFTLLLTIVISANAQKNIGIDFFNIKEYELAKKYFLQKLPENPAEANYYLGEIAFAEGRLEEATNYFNQGLQTNMDTYCRIGLAKVNYKAGQKSEATTSLLSIQKKFSRDIDVLVAVGYAYLDNQVFKEVESLLSEMMKVEKSNPKIYVLEGDMFRAKQQVGEAGKKYETAIYFDAKYALAYIKYAEIYERISWRVAVEKLNEVIERYPDFVIPYRYLGRIYTANGHYQKGIDAFKIFFAAGNYTLDDIGRYVTALFFNNNLEDANKMIKEGLAIAPDHFVLNRLQMYVAAKTLNIEAGLKYAEKFFSLQKNQEVNDYIVLDYSMYASLLKEAKMFDEAMEQYKKVLQMDSTAVDNYKEMATIAGSKRQSGIAADYLKLFVEKKGADKVDITDYFQLGRYYYSAYTLRNAEDTAAILNRYHDAAFLTAISENKLQQDSLLENKAMFIEKAVKYYLKQADKAFDAVIERNPETYQGYLWKARVQSLMDPDSELGLAKPYYEKVVELLIDREDKTKIINDSLLESYKFLGFYFYLKEDKPNIFLYWNKVLEVDPDNEDAKKVLKSIK